MAHGPLKSDPAIERFNNMREQAYIHFRWTPRTVRTAVLGFIVFPASVFYVAHTYHLRWDWTGKLKAESLTAPPRSGEQVE